MCLRSLCEVFKSSAPDRNVGGRPAPAWQPARLPAASFQILCVSVCDQTRTCQHDSSTFVTVGSRAANTLTHNNKGVWRETTGSERRHAGRVCPELSTIGFTPTSSIKPHQERMKLHFQEVNMSRANSPCVTRQR